MNTPSQTPKPHQLQESTAGEEDPGAGLDAQSSAIKPEGVAPSAEADAEGDADAEPYGESYENSLPGTDHNDTDGPKPYEGGNIARTMMQFAQTDSERGSPGLTPEEMRAMKR